MMTGADFSRTIRSIRERPREDLLFIWCNMIRFLDLCFLQGQLWTENDPAGTYRPIAALVNAPDPIEPDGFWPSIKAYPVEREEEARLVSFLSNQGPNDVELVVPVRNTARLMDWGRFDEAPEFPIYRDQIHPAVIEAVDEIRKRLPAAPQGFCSACRTPRALSNREHPDNLLDIGCGCGDLLQELRDSMRTAEQEWERYGCADLRRLRNLAPARSLEFHGIDINPENVEEARHRGLSNIRVGEAGNEMDLPGGQTFDIVVFCGLLNRQITTRDQAETILRNALSRVRRGGHIIITGYTSCHLTADDLSGLGLAVLRKCFPDRLFLDYEKYYLRQLYVARKDT